MPVDRGCKKGLEEVNGQCVEICNRGEKRNAIGRCVPERQGCRQGTEAFQGKCLDICEKGTRRNRDGRCVDIEVKCRDGFFKSKNGNCIRILRPLICEKGFRPDGQGGCIRIITLVPQLCPDNLVYNKRTKQCERRRLQPIDPDNGGDDGEFVPPNIQGGKSGIQLNPDVLQQLIPLKRQRLQTNQQEDCPKGFSKDDNGVCVEG